MIPYAPLRAALVVGFLLWVLFEFGGSLIRLIEPPQRVRATDTASVPQQDVNPRPTIGAQPPVPPLSEPQALETLRQSGYFDSAPLVQEADGAWTTRASRAGVAGKVRVRVGRDGQVSQP